MEYNNNVKSDYGTENTSIKTRVKEYVKSRTTKKVGDLWNKVGRGRRGKKKKMKKEWVETTDMEEKTRR